MIECEQYHCQTSHGVGHNFQKKASTTSFIDQGFKINAEYYKTEVLEQILLPEIQKLHGA
jgi:hypothetical protein